MNITGKYLEALKSLDDWAIVSDWAKQFGELYPELLEKANREAANYANESTGLRELAARISSNINRGAYKNKIEIDTSERPRRIRYVPEVARDAHDAKEVEEDVAPLRRDEIIRSAIEGMDAHDNYRRMEFEAVAKQLKTFFGLDFEVDHAKALLNAGERGDHHPDNFQLLLKAHNTKKNNCNWERLSIEEQVQYIEAAVQLQQVVARRFQIDMESSVLGSLLERLKKVY